MPTIKKVINKNGYAWLADCYIKGKRIKRRFAKKVFAEDWLASVKDIPPEYIARAQKKVESEGVVYFVQAADGPIKIGFSSALESRLSTMATHHYGQLIILGVIEADACYEKELHRKFRHLNLRREWFKPNPELLSFIKQNCQAL